jgi:hypothetical protein
MRWGFYSHKVQTVVFWIVVTCSQYAVTSISNKSAGYLFRVEQWSQLHKNDKRIIYVTVQVVYWWFLSAQVQVQTHGSSCKSDSR